MKRLADILLLILLASVTIVSASETACGQDWGYDTVVEPLPRPAWLDRIMMFCLPYHPAYEAGDTIKPMPWAQRLQDAGFVLAGMYTDGFCRLYEPAEGEDWPEKCREEVTNMHALGMKVIAGIYPFVGERGPRDLLTAHPEWRLRSGDELPEGPGRGCMVNPGFAEALRELLVRRVREYDIDGYQFDGWYQCTYCRCDGCVNAYKVETGNDIPPNDSFNREGTANPYLPPGRWCDFFTGKSFEGGQAFHVQHPFQTLPVFVREGGLVPMEVEPRRVDVKQSPLQIAIYGKGPNQFELYDDAAECLIRASDEDGPLDIHFGPLCRPEVIWSGRGTPKPQTAVFQDVQGNQTPLAVRWADNAWAVATPGGRGRLTVHW